MTEEEMKTQWIEQARELLYRAKDFVSGEMCKVKDDYDWGRLYQLYLDIDEFHRNVWRTNDQ